MAQLPFSQRCSQRCSQHNPQQVKQAHPAGQLDASLAVGHAFDNHYSGWSSRYGAAQRCWRGAFQAHKGRVQVALGDQWRLRPRCVNNPCSTPCAASSMRQQLHMASIAAFDAA